MRREVSVGGPVLCGRSFPRVAIRRLKVQVCIEFFRVPVNRRSSPLSGNEMNAPILRRGDISRSDGINPYEDSQIRGNVLIISLHTTGFGFQDVRGVGHAGPIVFHALKGPN